jgi:membrane protein YdbS with pleckstrin-like domain
MEQKKETLRPLAPAVKTVWRIKLGLFWLLLLGGTAAFEIIGYVGGQDSWLPRGSTPLLALVIGSAVTILLPSLRYRFWRFDLRPEELYLERGIFNRVRTIVPLRRIQHLDVSQDIIEREFDLGKLIVHTAGSRSSEVVLPGLLYNEAQALRDELRHYVLEDVV